jgi:hypothetical protein
MDELADTMDINVGALGRFDDWMGDDNVYDHDDWQSDYEDETAATSEAALNEGTHSNPDPDPHPYHPHLSPLTSHPSPNPITPNPDPVMTAYHHAVDAAEAFQCGGASGSRAPRGSCAPRGPNAEAMSEAEDDGSGDWHPSWLQVVVSDYEITRLRTIVENECDLVSRDIIPTSQLSNSIHALEQKLELQSQQEADLYEKVGRAVAAYAIFRGLQVYYGGRV